MRKSGFCFFEVFVVFLFIGSCFFVACGDDEANGADGGVASDSGTQAGATFCTKGQTKTCYCAGSTTNERACMTDLSGWEDCGCVEYSIWCDETSDLCWQDPQKDAYDTEDIGVKSYDALRYCQELVFGGYDDWVLPDIDELRTLIRGVSANETGGACEISEGSGRYENEGCTTGPEFEGPGAGGCYWPEELSGTCNKPDPAAIGHALETWASTPSSDEPDEWIGTVLFDNGGVTFNHAGSYGDVRCVRPGPSPAPSCEDSADTCAPEETKPCSCSDTKTGVRGCGDQGCYGSCNCTSFTPSKENEDICDTCDQIVVTFTVPEKLAKQPYQLAAFLYSPESWPPMGPPEGGTSDCQIDRPDIDLNKPYILTVPACTYYREKCLEGPHYLWAALIMEEMPFPMPGDGDYMWGPDADPIPVNEGEKKIIEMEIELEPVGSSE